ncbi:MAG: RluA family pseudouridine synthase [Treponema sp.]|jgi:23S rRNA pseudouridine955/2504/2580 synthase|nr:RluA family pseudouridine synthase [Treponema sp.]
MIELKAGENDEGRRLDRVLRRALSGCSLSLIHRLLRQGRVSVDGKSAAPSRRIKAGALITVDAVLPADTARRAAGPPPQTPAPPILWRGGGLIVFNKPGGLAVHGPGGLDGIARAFLAGSLPPSLSFRPGPLHRLDKPSSGIIVFSTGIEGARRFSALLREHRLKKYYLAVVEGRVSKNALWRDELFRDKAAQKTFTAAPGIIKGKTALTKVSPLAVTPPGAPEACTLLLAEITTGRTHQIRAQAAAHGHPLAGDLKYGARLRGGRRGFLLHAWKLELRETSPELSAGIPPSITAPPPAAFLERIRTLFGKAAADGLRADNICAQAHLPYVSLWTKM